MPRQNRSTAVRFLRFLMPVVGLSCAALFTPWNIVTAWLAPLPDSIQQQLEDAIAHDLDSIIVYVDQAGSPPALYAAGWKNRETQIPADPRALFKIASISKLYIATAATKLIHSHALSADATLASLLPELDTRIENADTITLRMLIQHRSGIPNFTDLPDFPWDNLPQDNRQVLALVLDHPAVFAPDEDYRYSNTNYLLIGEILDKTLGYSHHRYIKETILDPLGLQDTYSLLDEVDLARVASGYYIGYEPDIKRNNYIVPGGSMVATASDVGIFLRALNDGSLLTPDEQALYTSLYTYEHTGLLPGYQSIARYHPDIDAVVVQFVGTAGGNSNAICAIVYNRIVKILHKQHSKNADSP